MTQLAGLGSSFLSVSSNSLPNPNFRILPHILGWGAGAGSCTRAGHLPRSGCGPGGTLGTDGTLPLCRVDHTHHPRPTPSHKGTKRISQPRCYRVLPWVGGEVGRPACWGPT